MRFFEALLGIIMGMLELTLAPYFGAAALLIMIASLRTFSSDKLQFWRESSSGVNRLAFFLAKDTVDHFNTLLKPAVYLSMFYFYNDPRSTFSSNYITTLALIYCCTGIAYIVGIVLKPQPAQLVCTFPQLHLDFDEYLRLRSLYFVHRGDRKQQIVLIIAVNRESLFCFVLWNAWNSFISDDYVALKERNYWESLFQGDLLEEGKYLKSSYSLRHPICSCCKTLLINEGKNNILIRGSY